MKIHKQSMTLSFPRFLFFLLFPLFLCTSCKAKAKEIGIEKEPHWLRQYSFFDKNEYYNFFKEQIFSEKNTYTWMPQLKDFYCQRDTLPYWTVEGYQETLIANMLSMFQNSVEHGLSPNLFYNDSLLLLIDNLKSFRLETEPELYQTLWQLEFFLSKAYIKYVNAMQFGAINPKTVNGGKWLHKTEKADTTFVSNALHSLDTVWQFMETILPQKEEYLILQQELKKWYLLQDSLWDKIAFHAVDSGKSHEIIPVIAKRLELMGFENNHTSDTLDVSLLSVLNHFRKVNAIPETNTLDEETVKALNRLPQYYIEKIVVNLERLRWKIIPQRSKNYIAVNLADFSLSAYLNNEKKVGMRICCGITEPNPTDVEKRTKNGIVQAAYWESPMLHGEISQLVLNPQWNVPEKITEEEYYHLLVKNPRSFLEREKMFIIDTRTNKPILPDSIDWSKTKRKNFPYRLVQKSGYFNALGIIKFDFPNTEAIYLHDTPNKKGFLKRNRAITHGCIRLQQPLDLANVIFELNGFSDKETECIMIDLRQPPKSEAGKKYLEEKEKKEQEYYDKLSAAEKIFYQKLRPRYLTLKKKMPVYIEYYTCFLDENGDINYRDDVYFKDVSLRHQLLKGKI